MESDGKRFIVRQLHSDDIEEVSKLFTATFTEREVVLSHMKFDKELFYLKMGKKWTEDCCKDGQSIVCVDTTRADGDRIVAFRLSQTLLKSDDESNVDKNSGNPENSEFNKFDAFSSVFAEYVNAFRAKHTNDTKSLFFVALGVKDGYENLKIGSKLLEHCINLAKISNFEYIYVIASAPATQHMFTNKYKFTKVISKPYEEFEYKGQHFLKGITRTKELMGLELDLNEWDVESHPVSTTF